MNYIFRIVCKLSVMLILWRPLMPLIETESFELSSRYMLFQTNRKQDRKTSIATRQEFQDGKINQGARKTIQYILCARWNCTHIADAVQRLQKICENCNGSSKWHNKLIKTPEIGILLKCRIYVPSGSTLNQFDVSLMTLPAGAWIRHVQSMLLSYLLWAGGWLWIMPLSVVMYPCPPQPWEFPESTRNYYTFRSAWIYAKYWTKRSTRIYTKYQWILFLNPY